MLFTVAWYMLDASLTVAWYMLGACLTVAWYLLGTWLTVAWYMLARCFPMLDNCLMLIARCLIQCLISSCQADQYIVLSNLLSEVDYLGTGGFSTSGGAILTVTGLRTMLLFCSLRTILSGWWSLTVGINPNPLYWGWCVGYRWLALRIGLFGKGMDPDWKLKIIRH